MRRRDFDVLLRKFRDILKVKVRVVLDRGSVWANHPNESTLVMSLPPITQVSLNIFDLIFNQLGSSLRLHFPR